MRVRVEPAAVPKVETTVLRGELMLDAATHQLISLRGEILEVGGPRSVAKRLREGMFTAVGYLDLQSRETMAASGCRVPNASSSNRLAARRRRRAVWRFRTLRRHRGRDERLDRAATRSTPCGGPAKVALAGEPSWGGIGGRWNSARGRRPSRRYFGDVERCA